MIRFSKYNLCTQDKDQYIVYSCLSGAIITMPLHMYEAIVEESNLSSILPSDTYDILLKNKIICDDELELETIVEYRYSLSNNPLTLHLMIHSTLNCNFKCPYCFQLSYSKEMMNLDVADAIVAFIERYFQKNALTNLDITWTGGEPLLAIDVIEYIALKLKYVGIKSSMRMISNGSLLDDKMARRIVNIGVSSIQITIDGLYDNHNERRSDNNNDSFSKIISNIDNLLNNYSSILIKFRVNLDVSNINNYLSILKYLKNKYQDKNYLVYPELVRNYHSNSHINTLTKESSIGFYFEMFKANALDPKHIFSKPSSFCIRKSRYSFAIGPDGSIYDCELHVGNKSKTISHIKDQVRLMQYLNKDKQIIFFSKECETCSLLPICNYGCIYNKENNVCGDGEHCHLIKNYEEEFVKLYYDTFVSIPPIK
jgi:uncharacterized protein